MKKRKLNSTNPKYMDKSLVTEKKVIRRKLISGFGGAVMNQKGQAERTGLAYEDGYNYWYNVEVKGKQHNWFIQRGKDFSK